MFYTEAMIEGKWVRVDEVKRDLHDAMTVGFGKYHMTRVVR